MSADAPINTEQLIRHLRRKRRGIVRRRRHRLGIAIGAAAVALTAALGVASFTGTDLAGAAAARANNLMDLIDQRSPGTRTEARLTKMRRMAMSPPQSFAPPVALTVDLASALTPPTPAAAAVGIVSPPPPTMQFAPSLPGGAFLSPPGGGGGPPGGGGGTPGGGGGSPPGSPPIVTPEVPGAVPEPGTWMTMLLGFGLMGWMLRRQHGFPAAGARR